MIISVQDPAKDIVLNACFYVILLLALVGILPWRVWGYPRLSRWLKWLIVPVLALAVVYEKTMPSRYNIRIDLLLLLPAYALVLISSLVRWLAAWRGR